MRITQEEYATLVARGLLPEQPPTYGTRVVWPDRIVLVMFGPAMGAPRMTRRDAWKRRPAVVKYHEWRDRLRHVAGQVPPADQVLALDWTATFEPPASWSKTKRVAALDQLHRTRPDRDNIDKAILDALWPEDAGIAAGTIRKQWGLGARLEIVIRYINPHAGVK